ncbi:MAG: WG repeat-containing protein [Alistipes sp.]|nr:WG repeat-containing protein [Alistipes sp.]
MMYCCSIQDFHHALHNTHLFATLQPQYIEAVCRTTHFAECRAIVDCNDVLLHAPITTEAMALAERAYALLRGERGDRIGTFRILHNELNQRTSIIIEDLPDGITLDYAVLTMSQDRLLSGLSEFTKRLRHADISLNNLRKQNIIVDNHGHWHPIRLYYTTLGYGDDNEQLLALRSDIEQHAPKDNTLNEPLSAYRTEYTPLLEGRRRTTTAEGVGFMDEDGNMVIAPRYAWASDFDEGRAMVMTKDKRMGLIDTSGREVIKAQYEIVEYNAIDGNSWVRENDLWALFDYSGFQVTEWDDREMVDDDIML